MAIRAETIRDWLHNTTSENVEAVSHYSLAEIADRLEQLEAMEKVGQQQPKHQKLIEEHEVLKASMRDLSAFVTFLMSMPGDSAEDTSRRVEAGVKAVAEERRKVEAVLARMDKAEKNKVLMNCRTHGDVTREHIGCPQCVIALQNDVSAVESQMGKLEAEYESLNDSYGHLLRSKERVDSALKALIEGDYHFPVDIAAALDELEKYRGCEIQWNDELDRMKAQLDHLTQQASPDSCAALTEDRLSRAWMEFRAAKLEEAEREENERLRKELEELKRPMREGHGRNCNCPTCF